MGKAPAETIKAEEIYSCLGIHSDYMDFLDREFTKRKKNTKKMRNKKNACVVCRVSVLCWHAHIRSS
jgi:hypothetical protein